MELEFHYYITYLAAIEAGFNHDMAIKIAYASQYVDDNSKIYAIVCDNNKVYESCQTQISHLFCSIELMETICTVYHFIPGEITDLSLRKDGQVSKWATTSGCYLARQALEHAMMIDDPYLIGIATHAYTDTWAHQNFSGINGDYNELHNIISIIGPSIGHKDASNRSDIIGYKWHDNRPCEPIIDNNTRFLNAITSLFNIYCNKSSKKFNSHINSELGLKNPLNFVSNIFQKRQSNESFYNNSNIYLDKYNITKYDKSLWLNKAIIFDQKSKTGYRWRAPKHETDWFNFQEAAKYFKEFILMHINKLID